MQPLEVERRVVDLVDVQIEIFMGALMRRWLFLVVSSLSLVGVCGLPACVRDKPAVSPAPPVAAVVPAPPVDAAAARPAPAASPVPEEPPVNPLTRFYPGADYARSKRARKPIAVLLFAPPGPRIEDAALQSVPRLRLQPVVCSLHGKLAVGARCGEAMPARAKVRLSEAGTWMGTQELEVERSTVPFRADPGSQVYPAPYGPACCMYNTCVGKTVPYQPKDYPDGSVLTTTRTVLAVWPADAEIDLTALSPGLSEEVKVDDAPWTRPGAKGGGGPWPREADAEAPRLIQTALVRDRRYASVDHALQADLGKGWQVLLHEMGVREYYLLAAADLDADGRPELLVYARWANDYGFHVLGNDAKEPLYSFSCGNI